jgi:hypothetical protein
MAQQLLDLAQVGSPVQHVRRSGMPQGMRGDVGHLGDSGLPVHHIRCLAHSQSPTPRSEEHCFTRSIVAALAARPAPVS